MRRSAHVLVALPEPPTSRQRFRSMADRAVVAGRTCKPLLNHPCFLMPTLLLTFGLHCARAARASGSVTSRRLGPWTPIYSLGVRHGCGRPTFSLWWASRHSQRSLSCCDFHRILGNRRTIRWARDTVLWRTRASSWRVIGRQPRIWPPFWRISTTSRRRHGRTAHCSSWQSHTEESSPWPQACRSPKPSELENWSSTSEVPLSLSHPPPPSLKDQDRSDLWSSLCVQAGVALGDSWISPEDFVASFLSFLRPFRMPFMICFS